MEEPRREEPGCGEWSMYVLLEASLTPGDSLVMEKALL
jgi:hypothetical protein